MGRISESGIGAEICSETVLQDRMCIICAPLIGEWVRVMYVDMRNRDANKSFNVQIIYENDNIPAELDEVIRESPYNCDWNDFVSLNIWMWAGKNTPNFWIKLDNYVRSRLPSLGAYRSEQINSHAININELNL